MCMPGRVYTIGLDTTVFADKCLAFIFFIFIYSFLLFICLFVLVTYGSYTITPRFLCIDDKDLAQRHLYEALARGLCGLKALFFRPYRQTISIKMWRNYSVDVCALYATCVDVRCCDGAQTRRGPPRDSSSTSLSTICGHRWRPTVLFASLDFFFPILHLLQLSFNGFTFVILLFLMVK